MSDSESTLEPHLEKARALVAEQQIDELRALLQAGEVEARPELLWLAIEHDVAKAVEVLLSFGADVTHRDSSGMTPLHHAADVGGDSLRQTGKAVSLQVCDLLLRSGADPSALDGQGETPVALARSYGWYAAAALLGGADGRPASSRYVLSPSERPPWFFHSESYLQLVDQAFVELTPWTMLTAADALVLQAGLRSRYPERMLLPFARRQDTDDVMCWDRSRPREVTRVHDYASAGWEDEGRFGSFTSWYRSAIEDMAGWDDPPSRADAFDLPRHRRWLISGLDDPLLGRVFCDIEQVGPGDDFERARSKFERLCRASIPEARATEISRTVAESVACTLYRRSARGSRPPSDSMMLARQFIAAFEPSARFFSTFTYRITQDAWCATGSSVFQRAFEMGFFAADSQRAGVLWVTDDP